MPSWFSFSDFSLAFRSIILQSLPFLFLGSLISACLDQFIPDAWLGRLLRQRTGRGIVIGCFAGFFLPICECGAMPVVRRLILKGVPLSTSCAYFFSSSILNPLCIASTYFAFRARNPVWMCLFRIVGGLIMVVILSLLVRRWKSGTALSTSFSKDLDCRVEGDPVVDIPASASIWRVRMSRFVEAVSHDFLGVAGYVIVGSALAAFFNTSVNRSWLQPWMDNPWIAPLFTIGLSQVLCLCSTTDAFIIAAFSQVPPHAALAFLIAGPVFDFKLFWVYRTLFRWKVVIAIGVASIVVAYIFSLCVPRP